MRLKSRSSGLDESGLPLRAGVYRIIDSNGDGKETTKIQVYRYPPKGLCCFKDDFGSGGSSVDDRHDDHVSIQFTELTFLARIGNLNDPKWRHLD